MDMKDEGMKNACTVHRIETENKDITSVYIEGYDDKFRNRKAGQYLTLKIEHAGIWSEAHPFTISCAPEDPLLRLTIKKAGEFTSAIPGLKPGDKVICDGPYGVFCKDIENKGDIVMIAGGVGITPFLSVLRHFRNTGAVNNMLLLWSNKTMDDTFAGSEKYAEDAYPRVCHVPGRISQEMLKKHLVFKAPSFYLCGPPPMQESILAQLGEFGVDAASVEKENFSW